MILNERFKAPIISFGLGKTELTCNVGDQITVWQNEIFNGDEYLLEQNEIDDTITLEYTTLLDKDTKLYVDFIKYSERNNRPVYLNDRELGINVFIFWDGNKWMIVTDLIAESNEFADEIGTSYFDTPKPISKTWYKTGKVILPISTSSIISNTQNFKFNAVESKNIQIGIKSKTRDKILKSNIIKLTVIEP